MRRRGGGAARFARNLARGAPVRASCTRPRAAADQAAAASGMPRFLSIADVDNITRELFADSGDDVTFWLWATVIYAVARVAIELLFPGKIRGYTRQQYVIALAHQGVVLPICAASWLFGLFGEAPTVIYLLTGAYLASDSIINYSMFTDWAIGIDRRPAFNWGVHAHHIFTITLCALGSTLPPWLEIEGAVCILFGEFGSCWISITLLHPTPQNFRIRFFAFLASRLCATFIALDIARQIESPYTLAVFVTMVFGLVYDNTKTILAMRKNAHDAAGGRASSTWPL